MDGPMLAAGALFAAAAAYGARVGIREGVPGEPLGLRAPGSVPRQLAVGLGCGTSAPWPMPVAVIVAATRARPGSAAEARTCLALGACVLMGTLAEPVTWGRRSSSPAVTRSLDLHLLAAAALVLTGLRAASGVRPVR